eukprot:5322058-Prymnesium_polylepis.1
MCIRDSLAHQLEEERPTVRGAQMLGARGLLPKLQPQARLPNRPAARERQHLVTSPAVSEHARRAARRPHELRRTEPRPGYQ